MVVNNTLIWLEHRTTFEDFAQHGLQSQILSRWFQVGKLHIEL